MRIRIDVVLDPSQWKDKETLLFQFQDKLVVSVYDGINSILHDRRPFQPDYEIEVQRIDEDAQV